MFVAGRASVSINGKIYPRSRDGEVWIVTYWPDIANSSARSCLYVWPHNYWPA